MSLWLSIVSYAVALLAVALLAAYVFFGRKHDYWRRKGIKHIKPLSFVGNMKDLILVRKNIGVFFKEIYDKYKKEPYIGLYSFDAPTLLINDLNLVRAVLVTDFEYFCNRNIDLNAKVDQYLSRSLLILKGERWRQSRGAISQIFTPGKIKMMFNVMDECGKSLANALERENKGEPIAAYDLCDRYTTDVFSSAGFGINSGTLQDPHTKYRRMLKRIFEFSNVEAIKFTLAFLAPKLLERCKIKVLKKEIEDYVTNAVKCVITYREKEGIKHNDLLDHLLEIVKGESNDTSKKTGKGLKQKIQMDEYDLFGHSFFLLTAGLIPAAITMSFALYELSKRPDIQDKLRAEIIETFQKNEGNISYDAFQAMKYTDMVIQETLRKYPPVPFIDRRCSASYKLPGTELTVETGTGIIIPALAIHRDHEIYPDPMEFIPERFAEENKGSRPSCAYLPFGEGPRTCTGMRFGLIEAKVGLVHILKNHTVHRPTTTPVELDFNPKNFLLEPMEHVRLNFRKSKAS